MIDKPSIRKKGTKGPHVSLATAMPVLRHQHFFGRALGKKMLLESLLLLVRIL